MNIVSNVAGEILADCGAVIDDSHFVYASGRHGSAYVNKDALFLRPGHLSALCLRLATANAKTGAEVVVGPAVGGAILASWVGSFLRDWGSAGKDVRSAFADKTADGGYAFVRGYDAALAGRKVLVVEDVLTTGGSCRKVVDAVAASGGTVVGVSAIVNRGNVTAEDIGSPPSFSSLVHLPFPSWAVEECPMCAAGTPVRTDFGKGLAFLAGK